MAKEEIDEVIEADRHDERAESLWWLAAAPAVWVGHFIVCYATAAIYCAKADAYAALNPVRLVIMVATVVALTAIAAIGWRGMRRHRLTSAKEAHHYDTPAGRHRFLGFAQALLSGMSLLATLFVAMPTFFVETCR